MRPRGLGEVDPLLGRTQKRSERLRATALGRRELERFDKALGRAIIRWRASSAHRELEVFLQEELASGLRSERFALVAMKDGLRHRKMQGAQGRRDQGSAHVRLEG